jgi:flavin reductase (DIM6/NTAB) family NADH-FMN oxidoreductase RutF
MNIEIDKEKATRLINSGMTVLITTAYKDKVNITTCAWHMPISRKPASLGIALAKTYFSSELIKNSKEFIINIPDWALLDKVIFCGSFSGRNVDKFKETKLTPGKPKFLVKTPKIKECFGSIECILLDIKEIGDHYLFFGEVVYAEARANYFVNDFWDTNKVKFIHHLGSNFFFKSSPYTEHKK